MIRLVLALLVLSFTAALMAEDVAKPAPVHTRAVITTSPMTYLYYLKRMPDFYLLGEIWDVKAHAGRLIRTAADLEAALDRPGTAFVLTKDGEMGNPAFLTNDMAALLEKRATLTRSRLDKRTRYYEEKPAG